MAHFQPTGYYNPLYKGNNQGFGHCSVVNPIFWHLYGMKIPIPSPSSVEVQELPAGNWNEVGYIYIIYILDHPTLSNCGK